MKLCSSGRRGSWAKTQSPLCLLQGLEVRGEFRGQREFRQYQRRHEGRTGNITYTNPSFSHFFFFPLAVYPVPPAFSRRCRRQRAQGARGMRGRAPRQAQGRDAPPGGPCRTGVTQRPLIFHQEQTNRKFPVSVCLQSRLSARARVRNSLKLTDA